MTSALFGAVMRLSVPAIVSLVVNFSRTILARSPANFALGLSISFGQVVITPQITGEVLLILTEVTVDAFQQ